MEDSEEAADSAAAAADVVSRYGWNEKGVLLKARLCFYRPFVSDDIIVGPGGGFGALTFIIGSPKSTHESLTSTPPGTTVLASLIRSPILGIVPSPTF